MRRAMATGPMNGSEGSRRRLLAPATCLGIDGCARGWIIAAAGDLTETPAFHVARGFRELARGIAGARTIAGIDVPIGLADGPRRCDAEARALLGPGRASSVFTPPARAALAGRTAAEIRARNVAVTGKSLSEQALNILPKIREVDAVMTPALQKRVREVHPEVVYAALSGRGRGLATSKKLPEGRAERLALLPPTFARAAPTRADRPFPAAEVALDDYVDALAALVAALRVARGEARRLPAEGEDRDARGLVMEIVY
jgi:predicted RNase H-like nuclease